MTTTTGELGLRLNGRPGLPVLTTLAFATACVALGEAWPHLQPMQLLAGALMTANVGTGLLFALTRRVGRSSRAKIAAQFRQALAERRDIVRIGGVRWVVNDGEFHRFDFASGDRAVYFKAGTSWSERSWKAVEHQRDRFFRWGGLFVAMVYGFPFMSSPEAAGWIVGVQGLYLTLLLLFGLSSELALQLGWQGMRGAFVLDPEPTSLRSQEVEEQKVHGDARVSTPGEARTATRSPLEQREF